MTETVHSETRTETSTSYRDYGGRTRAYGAVGVLLLLTLLIAVGLAYFQVDGPNLVLVNVAVWVLSLVVFIQALCLLYVLFTLRGALRLVRAQATEVAVVRALAHRHEILETGSAPPIEYNPPSVVQRHHTGTPPQYATPMMASRDVEVIEGIGPVFARRLARAGIETLRDLRAATTDQIADATQAPRPTVDRWKAMADLMVVRDIDEQAAEVLVACNIYSVEGLAAQDADSLHRRCVGINRRGDNRIMPANITRDMVSGWIEAARRYGADGATNTPSRGTNAPEPDAQVVG
jgi:predicted flap endonuclease-1-like 5' DNA nuclease